MKSSKDSLLRKIKDCELCRKDLPCDPKPILNFKKSTPIVLIGQAPGLKTHIAGVPWADQSGERLRSWLGLSNEQFYDLDLMAFVPMGFCYPGAGKSGDLPPMPRCAPTWHDLIFKRMENIKLKIYIGSYAYKYYFKNEKITLTEKIKKMDLKNYILLPHPSPRNNIWIKKNKWFEEAYLPLIQKKIQKLVIKK